MNFFGSATDGYRVSSSPTATLVNALTGAFKFLSKGEVVLIRFQRDGSTTGMPIVIKQRSDDRVSRVLKNAPMPSAITAPHGKISVHGLNISLGT